MKKVIQKEITQAVCDVCGGTCEDSQGRHVIEIGKVISQSETMPVHVALSVKLEIPYRNSEELDLCKSCLAKAVNSIGIKKP